MKNIHILPTTKNSKIATIDGILEFDPYVPYSYGRDAEDIFINTSHIYITSDEEIKEGDFSFYPPFGLGKNLIINGELRFHIEAKDGIGSFTQKTCQTLDVNKKVVLTTDRDLVKDGVQEIEDEFLRWFIKNPSCESVEITQMCGTCGAEGKEGDNYCERSKECNRRWAGEKYKIIIPEETELNNGIPKGKLDYMIGVEETEVNSYAKAYARNYARQMWGDYHDNEYDTGMDLTYGEVCKKDFLAGVEWQKQQTYTEEDLREAFRQGQENITYDEMHGYDSDITEDAFIERFNLYYKKHKL